MLVEDHAPMRDMIADHLKERGFAVEAVDTGETALEVARAVAFDAPIFDLGLPDMDGMEFLKQLRSRSGAGLPVLILTARDGVKNRVRGLNTGADDYSPSPSTSPDRLAAALRDLVRNSA